ILAARRANRPGLAVAAYAVAIAAKPTAVLLIFACPSLLAGAAVTSVVWLPFLLVDPIGLLSAGQGVNPVLPNGLIDLLGFSVDDEVPGWWRPLQFAVAVSLTAVIARRGHLLVGLV